MFAQGFFLVTGLLAVGYVGCIYAVRFLHQAYQDRNFERALAHAPELAPPSVMVLSKTEPAIKPPIGSLIGKILIPRLGITAIVDEGVDSKTLALSVGHIPSTALPGEPGNVGLAAHRDTLFRNLKDVRRDDEITLMTLAGSYFYRVVWFKVVNPTEVSVLKPSLGEETLTLVTCYPFYFVGHAPKRFIVRAQRRQG